MQKSGALAGRVAIVTGGGQGIGRAHCLRLAAEGARVVVNDIGHDAANGNAPTSRAEQVVQEICEAGGEARANLDSIGSLAGARRLVEQARDIFGKVDILINNAGNLRPGTIFDVVEDDIDQQVEVHLKGTIGTVMAVAPLFREQRSGVVVNTGSESGLGQYGNSIYAAVKEGVAGFTRSVARDLGVYGARANLIRPAALTAMSTSEKINELIAECEIGFGIRSTEHFWLSKMIVPEATALSPDRVSDFVTWLCTDQAAHINGQDFRVMGSEIGLLAIPFPVRSAVQSERWTFEQLTQSGAGQSLHGSLTNEYQPKRQDADPQ